MVQIVMIMMIVITVIVMMVMILMLLLFSVKVYCVLCVCVCVCACAHVFASRITQSLALDAGYNVLLQTPLAVWESSPWPYLEDKAMAMPPPRGGVGGTGEATVGMDGS
jgi:hypothetical protein